MRYEDDSMAKAGRPREEDRSKVRDKLVPQIRVTEIELAQLKAGASADGKTLGPWLRELGLSRARRALKAPKR